jgi:hypothetical protein
MGKCTWLSGWVADHDELIDQFCGANVDRVIDALPGTWSESRPKKYPPITAGEYVNMRLNATYK